MYLARKLYLGALWVLSIQQKFRFEISKIQLAQWSCTCRLHRPDPSHRAFGYCSCKQDTKERYREKQFGQMERVISVRPTEITGPVKVQHLQSWSRIFWSDQTEMVCSIWCTNQNFRNLNWRESALFFLLQMKIGPPFYGSSKPRESLAACSAKGVPSFPSYFKTVSIGPTPGIEPATSRSAVKRSTDWANVAAVNCTSSALLGRTYSSGIC